MSAHRCLSSRKDAVKMSLVCTNCREKHLKCSGAPTCMRCRNDDAQCVFVPSRRGMRPTRVRSRTPQQAQPSSSSQAIWTSTQPAMMSIPEMQWAGERFKPADNIPVPNFGDQPIRPVSSDNGFRISASTLGGSHMPEKKYPAGRFGTDRAVSDPLSMELINKTYESFLIIHPFALPKEVLVEHFERPEVRHLRAVIEFIGTYYGSDIDKATHADYAERLYSAREFPHNAYTVQAFLLLAIRLAADGELAKAVQVLQRSRNCALRIGMNIPEFAQLHSGGSSHQASSWQATWTALSQLCHAWSLDNAMGVLPQFAPHDTPATSTRGLSTFSADQQLAGRRSLNMLPENRTWNTVATSWSQSPALIAATDFFSEMPIYDGAGVPSIPGADWSLRAYPDIDTKYPRA